MRRRKKKQRDNTGLRDMRNLIATTRPDLLPDPSGVITLSRFHIPPSLEAPLVHPVELRPEVVEGGHKETRIGIYALLAGIALLSAILVGALFGTNDPSGSGVAPEPGSSGSGFVPLVDQNPEGDLSMDGLLSKLAGADEDVQKPQPVASPAAGVKAVAKKKNPAKNRKKRASRSRAASELDDLLGPKPRKKSGKAARRFSKKRASASDAGSLPRSLNRVEVNRGLRGVAARAGRCGKGHGGVVTVEVVIGPSGKVKRSRPKGASAGSSTGKCVTRAVKRAKFPKFAGKPLTVQYPFRLK